MLTNNNVGDLHRIANAVQKLNLNGGGVNPQGGEVVDVYDYVKPIVPIDVHDKAVIYLLFQSNIGTFVSPQTITMPSVINEDIEESNLPKIFSEFAAILPYMDYTICVNGESNGDPVDFHEVTQSYAEHPGIIAFNGHYTVEIVPVDGESGFFYFMILDKYGQPLPGTYTVAIFVQGTK